MITMNNQKLTKILFVIGFVLLILAQISFSFTDAINLLEPIDFIHWTILIGAVLVIPGVLRFSNGMFSKIGTPITLAGIATTIGMCAIDFVLWSYNSDQKARADLYYQLIEEPSIWMVFITVGPALFFVGLSIQSFDYLKTNIKGVLLTNIGAVVTGVGGLLLPFEYHFVMIIGYMIFAFGANILLFKRRIFHNTYFKVYDVLFIIGLLLEMIGQILLMPGNEFVYALKPIDFAHWSLLLGAVFMIPKIVNFPNKLITYIGTPLAMIGVVCFIGMCILDFMWWNMPNQEMRVELASHLSKFPSIWIPFITKGTAFFNIGILILSFNYIKKNILAVSLIILATLIIFVGGFIPHRLILVYLITAIGYALIFFKKASPNEYKTQ